MRAVLGLLVLSAVAGSAAAQSAPLVAPPGVNTAQTSNLVPGYDPVADTGDVCGRVQRRADGGWIVRKPLQLTTADGGAYGVLRLEPGQVVDGGRLPGVGALDTVCVTR